MVTTEQAATAGDEHDISNCGAIMSHSNRRMISVDKYMAGQRWFFDLPLHLHLVILRMSVPVHGSKRSLPHSNDRGSRTT